LEFDVAGVQFLPATREIKLNQSRFLGLLLGLLTVLVVAVGCGGQSGAADPNVTQTIGPGGGTFAFREERVILAVPQLAFPNSQQVSVHAATNLPGGQQPLAGTAWSITSSSTLALNQPITMRFSYSPASLPVGADENTLQVMRLHNGQWVPIDTTVNTANKTVTFQTAEFGTYGVFVEGGIGTPIILRTVLTAGQETHVVNQQGGFAVATVTISEDRTSLNVNTTIDGLDNATVTAAHIHLAHLGENGPIAADLFTGGSGNFTGTINHTVTQENIRINTVPTIGALIEAILEGRAYINVHATTDPAGVLRGQLGEELEFSITLDGGQEHPPVTTDAGGTGTLRLNRTMTEMTLHVNTHHLENVTGAHIHHGPRGENGPVIFNLFPKGEHTTWNNVIHLTLTAADFTSRPQVPTFDAAIGELLSGRTYVNVHTTMNPAGEIRGQIEHTAH
jgi:hypothetical protein